MEPKFQSSFIPKGPIVSDSGSSLSSTRKQRSILGMIAGFIFGLSILGAAGALAYKLYLDYSIDAMAAELEAKRAHVEEETVAEILRLNNRLIAAENLISSHTALSPFFDFLETSTLQSVRFTEFNYEIVEGMPKISMRGEASSYTTLALQADVLNKSENFNNPVFSDVSLDERGNVAFSFQAELDRNLISFRREVERAGIPASSVTQPAATTTPAVSTTTPASATTTPRNQSGN